MPTFKITQQGFQDLEQELEQRKEKRDVIINDIQEARAQGDLSENADYESARDAQAENESRIKRIEQVLKDAVIIRSNGNNVVGLGSTVKFLSNGREYTMTIVGTLEADPFNKRISNESPIGKALIGHKKGDHIHTRSYSDTQIHLEILAIQ